MRPVRAPEPPLNPYMRYSRKLWHKVRQENPERPLWDIAKIISSLWRDAAVDERHEYQLQYESERVEYEKALKNYMNAIQAQQQPSAMAQQMKQRSSKQSERTSRRQEPTPGVVIQPVIDEDPFEVNPRRLAAIRFERNQRLLLNLFDGQQMSDPRTFFGPQRIEMHKKQCDNLVNHKTKIIEEMERSREAFERRKRAIQEDAANFEAQINAVSEKRPRVDEETYKKMVEDASAKLLEQYTAYQKRQDVLKAQKEAEHQDTPILYSLTVNASPPATDAPAGPLSSTSAAHSSAGTTPGAVPPPATDVKPTPQPEAAAAAPAPASATA